MNLVIHGVKEPKAEGREEQLEEDQKKYKRLQMRVTVKGKVEVKFRAGKKEEGNRDR